MPLRYLPAAALGTPIFWWSCIAALNLNSLALVVFGWCWFYAYLNAMVFIYKDFYCRSSEDFLVAISELKKKYSIELMNLSRFVDVKHLDGFASESEVHVIVATPKDSTIPPLSFCRAYSGSANSFVIIGQMPQDIGCGQIFLLLHEVGHTI